MRPQKITIGHCDEVIINYANGKIVTSNINKMKSRIRSDVGSNFQVGYPGSKQQFSGCKAQFIIQQRMYVVYVIGHPLIF